MSPRSDQPDPSPASGPTEGLLAAVLAHLDALVSLKDADGRYLYVNPAVAEVLGMPADEVVGRRDADVLPPAAYTSVRAQDVEVLTSGERSTIEESLVERDGSVRHLWSVRVPIDAPGHPAALLRFSTDITELVLLREELERRASTDALTGLPNRWHFYEQAERTFSRARRYGEDLSLLVLDIDHFKSVNDTFGHQAGDRVLVGVADHLRSALRASDVAGRVGGEEFAVLLPHTTLPDAVILAERLRNGVSRIRFTTESGRRLSATISIGATALLADDGGVDELVARADKALYRAKETGRNRVVDSEHEPAPTATAHLRLVWNPAYACGHPVIDGDHRELFRLANDLLDLAVVEPLPPSFLGVLDDLIAHVRGHFAREEGILRRYGYGDVDGHAELHRALGERAAALRRHAEDGTVTFGDLVDFLSRDVVARHLLHEDREFFEVLAHNPAQRGGPRRSAPTGAPANDPSVPTASDPSPDPTHG